MVCALPENTTVESHQISKKNPVEQGKGKKDRNDILLYPGNSMNCTRPPVLTQ
jgi:hypothetical protein